MAMHRAPERAADAAGGGIPHAAARVRVRSPRLAPLGPATALALLAGVSLCFLLPALPPWPLAALSALAVLPAWWRLRSARLPAALLFGFSSAMLHGALALEQRIDPGLHGADTVVSGRIVGLPESGGGRVRFDFIVVDGVPGLAGRRLRLAWYRAAAELHAGEHWQLQVRLRRPRGTLNPGGFDFERHALQRRLAATGYVREGPANRRLSGPAGIDRLRERLSAGIQRTLGSGDGRFIAALAVADTRGLGSADWDLLRATGTTHLIAISGLHVGLVAGFGALLVQLLYRLHPRAGLRLALPQAAAIAALAMAAGYAALAGFGLPTVRTVAMIAAVLAAVLWRRRGSAWQGFALALAGVLLFDPLAPLAPGFWLSFAGVAWLLWCLPRTASRKPVRALLQAQGVMTVALLPMTAWFFGQASLVAAVANLLAVPWVSFVVVPLALVGSALLPVSGALGALPLGAAAGAMALLWQALEALAGWHGALQHLPEAGLPALLLACAGAFWLLLPRAVPGKPLALLLWLPLLLPAATAPGRGEAELTVLDVGQGLAVLVRTGRHALLYDTGPAFRSGLDAGEATVVPALRALGVERLDAIVVSHGDGDHAGGTASVLRAFPEAAVLSGEPGRVAGSRACVAGQAWRWDGVAFEMLHPPSHFPSLANESSCVLRIVADGGAALLTGDISTTVEARLVRDNATALATDVLLVPHHGSRSSSGQPFLAAAGATLAVVSAGHGSRFGHPHPEVVERYLGLGARVVSTADGGALRIRIGGPGHGQVEQRRETHRRFWHE